MKISGRKDFRAKDLFTATISRLTYCMLQNMFYRTLAAGQIMDTVPNPFFIACVALNNRRQ
jgi:hypothetical protein